MSERGEQVYLVFVTLNHEEMLEWISVGRKEDELELVDGLTAELAIYSLNCMRFFHLQYLV